ncbi:hypothetical protein MSG28_011745 [Choristoneura fumiferana]|uniref:Uncharacterized protein n=2 Tax=Choristoneura fumiferana TaxID=7141 RepID=A0ACC0KLM0_CHOFU|nr:hypothetical protein MSG28_011745 [Choristoneura fumiferana]KAI8437421.1 hypothetical protein MSG28_011745 [Choristoneura fumiferana]
MAQLALLLLLALSQACAYHILVVFPVPGKSHNILGQGYVKNLLEAGHEVTYVTPFPTHKTTAKYHEVDISKSVEKFDPVFDCPLIWSSSLEPHWLILRLIHESSNPAFNPDALSTATPPFSFVERLKSLFSQVFIKAAKIFYLDAKEKELYEEIFGPAVAKRGRVLPPYGEAIFNGSFMLTNSHSSLSQPISVPPNSKEIGGYHIDPNVKPLPADLQKLMDEAKHGVIYFSMGSNAKSKDFPDSLKQDFLKVLGGVKQTVIWKFEEDLPNRPKNVHIVQWAPQPSILAHPNCRLFITHGGLLSTTEAIYFGVPTIVMPYGADQHLNAIRAVQKGYARKVQLSYEMAGEMKLAIDEIIGNPKYMDRVKELSKIYHDRLVPPGKELVHWVEHVVRTGGAPHLRSPALMLPWYQKMYLDLFVVVSFLLTNSYPAVSQPISMPPNTKEIGGYHIDPNPKPLPADLQKLMDEAEHGVIYFSMGSNAKSKDFPDVLKQNFLRVLGDVKQTVIWKFEEDLPNRPKNVHIVQWAPQTSILERVKALSKLYHDRLVPPGKELVHWVEHVVRTGGAPHLRSPALMLPWYQKMYLDLAAVTYVTPYPTNKTTAKYHEIDLSINVAKFDGNLSFLDTHYNFSVINKKLAAVYNCPFIWSSSIEPHWLVLRLIHESSDPAFNPDIFTTTSPPFSFVDRAGSLFRQIAMKAVKYFYLDGFEQKIYKDYFGPAVAKRGRVLPNYYETVFNASFMLANSHPALSQPISMPPNVKEIGGYHINPEVKPLPADLQKLMDEAQHGVIYFSMGSNVKSKDFPESLKQDLFRVLGEFKQTVIWKFEEDLPNKPKNIHVVQWAPQQSILAHRNCRLFITHGGLLSTTETIFFGVPTIVIPYGADQHLNALRAVKKGYALMVELSYEIPREIKVAVDEMMNNPKYTERVKELSKLYHDRLVPPGKELVHWVEHVVRTGGALHLRSPALMLPWADEKRDLGT